MKPSPTDFQSSDTPLSGRETAEDAIKRLTPYIDRFLDGLDEPEFKKLMLSLNTPHSTEEAGVLEPVTLRFFKWLEENRAGLTPDALIKPEELISLLKDRALGFEETQRTKIESPWADQSVLDEQRTLLRKVPLASNNEEDNAAATAVQEVRVNRNVLPPDSAWADRTQSPDEIHQFYHQLPEEIKESILPEYLKINRDDRKQVTDLTNKHGVPVLKLDHDISELAEKLGCSVEDLRKALKIVLKGGHVVSDNLRQKVIISPEADPRRAKTVVVSRSQREHSILAKARGGIKRFFKRDE